MNTTGGGRPRAGTLRDPGRRRPRRRPGELPHRRRRHDPSAHRGRPARGRQGHRDGAGRRRARARRGSAGSRCSPTAPSCGTTSSSTPRPSTSSPPGERGRTSAWRPPTAERGTPPRLRRCLKGTPSTGWPASRQRCSPAVPVHVTSPQGRFAAGAALLDGRVARRASSPTASTCSRASAATPCTSTSACTARSPAAPAARRRPAGALRMRWEADGPGRRRGVDRPARPDRLRGAGPPGGRRASSRGWGPIPLRPRRRRRPPPIARIARSRTRDRRTAHGPVGARRRRQRVPRRTALPARGLAVPARPGGRRASSGTAMWADLVTLMRAGVRLGRIVTTRPEHRSRRARARRSARTPTTSTGAPGCPAGSAAPRCARR